MSKAPPSTHCVKRQILPGGADEPCWVPNTDVYQCEQGLVVKVELAGIRKEDLNLVIEGNTVKISGQRLDAGRSGKCRFLLMEINYGAFENTLELPDGYDLCQAKASFQNGFLSIEVPVKVELGGSPPCSMPPV